MIIPTHSPATASGSTGHQTGSEENPSASGAEVYVQCCTRSVSLRNQYATTAIGTPRAAATTSSPT